MVTGEGAPLINDNKKQQKRLVRQILQYPGVKRQQGYWTGDIALVHLESSLAVDEYTRPVCIPSEETRSETDMSTCVVKSWNPNPSDQFPSPHVHQTLADLKNLTVCNTTHYHNRLSSSHVCADLHQEFPGPCHGIEGSPLMCLSPKGTWEIEGLLSHYSNCGTANHPAIFTSLRHLRTWVINTVGKSSGPSLNAEEPSKSSQTEDIPSSTPSLMQSTGENSSRTAVSETIANQTAANIS